MPRIPIALQLYSVRAQVQKDLPNALAEVAKIGYKGAEPWGYKGDVLEWMGHSCQDIRKMYDDNGLACCGIHLTTSALLGDNLKRTVEFNRILGNRFLIVAADKPRMSAYGTIMELARILNETAELLMPHGMYTGYHAHPFDFEKIDGREAWDILFSNVNPEIVMQMDIGNCASGNGDPIHYLRKFTGRARSVHLKDYGGPAGSVWGEGKADWAEVFRLCETVQPTEWYVVEEGDEGGTGFATSARSFEALRKMGKV
ncbi:MAG: Inosose dehydratase [candidate division BRC1 bacterium ADurb.BinA364]|nr:MAG: Inosose dehydratase [candidate division BRC1 bacterium ADurb.BinA364]